MSLPPFLGVFLITIFVSGPIQWSYLMLHVVFLSAIMEQTTESEDDSLQTACIHIIFNRPEVFCNTAVSDSVCLCFCKGSYWTGSLEIPKYTKMYPTLGTKGVLAFGPQIPGAPGTLCEVLLWFNRSRQLSPTQLLAQSSAAGWGRELEIRKWEKSWVS